MDKGTARGAAGGQAASAAPREQQREARGSWLRGQRAAPDGRWERRREDGGEKRMKTARRLLPHERIKL